MNIMLLADNKKTDLLANFCVAYRQILGKYNLISTFNISKQIKEASGLNVYAITTEIKGTLQQLASKTLYNEIYAVIFLRDPDLGEYNNVLLRACDLNSVPYATNIATAEILVLALNRGDLEWRELIH